MTTDNPMPSPSDLGPDAARDRDPLLELADAAIRALTVRDGDDHTARIAEAEAALAELERLSGEADQ